MFCSLLYITQGLIIKYNKKSNLNRVNFKEILFTISLDSENACINVYFSRFWNGLDGWTRFTIFFLL